MRNQIKPARLGASVLLSLLFSAGVLLPADNSQVYAQNTAGLLDRLVETPQNPSDDAATVLRMGRDLIAEESWGSAEKVFRGYVNTYPNDRNTDAALYWLAFAMRKQEKYKQADMQLELLISNHPKSSWIRDARALRLQIAPHLGRGQVTARAVEEAKEDELKIIALQSLFAASPERATPIAANFLQPNSRASRRLKEATITLLGRYGGKQKNPILINLARNEPDLKLRKTAITMLATSDDESVLNLLKDLVTRPSDPSIVEASLYALARHPSPRAVSLLGEIARGGPSVPVRQKAISWLGRRTSDDAADELIRLYDADANLAIRKQIIGGLARKRKNLRAKDKILAIARGGDNIELRREAIDSLRDQEQALDLLLQLYDTERSEELKDAILSSIGQSQDKRAQRKLMEVARSNAPVERRKRAITLLSRSKDPEVLKFLEGILQ